MLDDPGPPFERIFAYFSLSFVVALLLHTSLERAGVLPRWAIFTEFITSEDIAAAHAEELADQEKAAVITGKPVVVEPLTSSAQADASESTPLLARPTTEGKTVYNWQSIAFITIGVFELALRTVAVIYVGLKVTSGNWNASTLGIPIAFLTSWLYATLEPLFRPSPTVSYNLLIIYITSFLSSLAAFYSINAQVPVESSPWNGTTTLVVHILNATLTLGGISILWKMPLQTDVGEPTFDKDGLHPAYEDFVNFGEWILFTWVSRIITTGKERALNESDLWQLSPLLRSRVLMNKFRNLHRKTLLLRLLTANAKDLASHLFLTVASALITLSQPLLLSLILKALGPDKEVSIQSFPLHRIAFSLPALLYTIPDTVFSLSAWPTTDDPYQSASMFEPSSGASAEKRKLAYFYALLGFVLSMAKTQINLQQLYTVRRASVRVQSELVASIYEKALVRKDITGVVSDVSKNNKGKGKGDDTPEKAINSADVGKIVSLITTDSTRIAFIIALLTRIYEQPVNVIGAGYLLYSLMGYSAFIGYIVFVIVTPGSSIIMKRMFAVKKTVLNARDKRMREMNQAIQAIKFIKFFAWESRWVERIMAARQREIKWLVASKFLTFFLGFLWDVAPLLVSVVSFSYYVLVQKGEFTVAIAFPALQLFVVLTQGISALPKIVQYLLDGQVSLQRIDDYLNEDEVPSSISWKSPERTGIVDPKAPFDDRLGCENASFKWILPAKPKKVVTPKQSFAQRLGLQKKSLLPILATDIEEEVDRGFEMHNLTITFKRGAINLVTGPTGSGKSSLLAAILGEMNLTAGKVYLPKNPNSIDSDTGLRNDVSFCTQQPWLQHQSIRDNILFGSSYDAKRYEDVLEACALNPDLDLFEDRDETEIGEKGVSLSGGQKARVALARAIYARSKTVILDDVLSAVDSHTAESLIKNCICGPLLANRTIILVTHHVNLVLHSVAWVVQLVEGSVFAQGTVEDLQAEGLLMSSRQIVAEETQVIEVPIKEETAGEVTEIPAIGNTARKLVKKEVKAEGRVQLKIYGVYFSAASYIFLTLVVLLVTLCLFSKLAQQFWIRYWGESYEQSKDKLSVWRIPFQLPSARDNVLPWLGGYIVLQFITAMFTIVSQIPSILSSLRASRKLYNEMLRSVIRAPVRWFDTTPSGRILNRFSKDIDTVDTGLQSYIMGMMETIFSGFIAVGTIVIVAPYSAFPLALFGFLQWWFTQGYVNASRDLRRMESNFRSPIISSFAELINGISTVRAFGAEQLFANNFFQGLDRTTAASYYYWMCNRWIFFRFDAIGACVVLFSTVMSIRNGVSSGLVAIIISQAQGIIYGFYWTLRWYTELEQSLNSIERISDYLDLPSEPPAIVENNRPPAYWPSNSGGIQVENLVLKYAPELEPVLRGVTFEIRPKEKIGLVGRTGSGKSTMALAFFRFVDPAEGKITIDGIDITTIGLEDLRSRLTIIPQDAVLFSGTIRENLDPFEEHSDEDCLDVLRRVHLRTSGSPPSTAINSQANSRPVSVHDSENSGDVTESSTLVSTTNQNNKIIITLDSQVSEGGSNFSSGQRQLIAMARALLRRSQIVIMDESTASVDFATDLKIQEAIHEEFSDSILITIAHRLRTVIEYDRILVLDAGKVVEFDTPQNLLSDEKSTFYSMCVKSGDFEALRESATKRAADRSGFS